MLTYNNDIFRNCFVIIHYHLTKVLYRINMCITFKPYELSITDNSIYGTVVKVVSNCCSYVVSVAHCTCYLTVPH